MTHFGEQYSQISRQLFYMGLCWNISFLTASTIIYGISPGGMAKPFCHVRKRKSPTLYLPSRIFAVARPAFNQLDVRYSLSGVHVKCRSHILNGFKHDASEDTKSSQWWCPPADLCEEASVVSRPVCISKRGQ